VVRSPKSNSATPVESIHHGDKRSNIPTADAHDFVDPQIEEIRKVRYARDESLDPQLVWRGKYNATSADDELVTDAPPIYIQEKIDPKVLVENLRTTAVPPEQEPEFTLFDTFDGLDELDIVDFYQHEANWSNRMILGDSQQVMASLAEREQLRGKVQMVYLDPPYGIKFGSNWQVSARKRDVKDGKLEDAAREAEQIKAFRDTWELGIHSYLSYLRDRLLVARDLLTESGSCFVQIGDENVHLVRSLMDEVFGSENFCSLISYKTTSGAGSFAGGTNVWPRPMITWFGTRDRPSTLSTGSCFWTRVWAKPVAANIPGSSSPTDPGGVDSRTNFGQEQMISACFDLRRSLPRLPAPARPRYSRSRLVTGRTTHRRAAGRLIASVSKSSPKPTGCLESVTLLPTCAIWQTFPPFPLRISGATPLRQDSLTRKCTWFRRMHVSLSGAC